MQIADGVYVVSNPIASHLQTINIYLLADGDESYIVDTGWPPEVAQELHGRSTKYDGWDMLMQLFEEARLDPKKLSGIILTHSHQDHLGYVKRLREYTGAKLLVSQREVQEFHLLIDPGYEARQRVRGWYLRDGVPPERLGDLLWLTTNYGSIEDGDYTPIEDGQIIKVGKMNWRVVWTPGHSWGHCCLFEPDMKLVLTGDHILAHDTPVITAFPSLFALRRNPLGAYRWSLKRMAEIDANLGLPAHGRLMPDFQQIVQRQLNHHDQRYDDVVDSLRSGEKTAFEVACDIPFVGRKKHLLELDIVNRGLAFFEAVSHLHSLEERGVVEQVERGYLFYWRLTGLYPGRPDDVDPRHSHSVTAVKSIKLQLKADK